MEGRMAEPKEYGLIACRKAKRFSENMLCPDSLRFTHEFSKPILHAMSKNRSKALRMLTDRFVLVAEMLKQEISSLIFGSTSQSVDD
jgi:hypothetical protein